MSPPPPLKEGEAPKTTSLPLLDALLHRLVERKRDAEEVCTASKPSELGPDMILGFVQGYA
jgi:hypothetical protein